MPVGEEKNIFSQPIHGKIVGFGLDNLKIKCNDNIRRTQRTSRVAGSG
jgi:hypothetical protein